MSIGRTRYVSRPFRCPQRKHRQSTQTEPHWLDIWLPRISHFSQFGLFVVTIGGLYFTVLPLYQKAVLEEAIARKEVQLAASEKAIEESYARFRSFAIREFVSGTGAKCSSLLFPSRALRTLNEKLSPAPYEAEEIFSINTGACLKEEFHKSKILKELRSSDLQVLAEHVDRIAASIAAKRRSTLVEYRSVPSRAKTDPSILNPLGSFSDRMAAFLSKSQPAASIEAHRFSLAVKATQSAVAHEYGTYIRNQIATLCLIKWKASQ